MNVMTKASDMLKAEWKVSMTPDDIYRHSMDISLSRQGRFS